MSTHAARPRRKAASRRESPESRRGAGETQVNIRFSEETAQWLEARAGGRRAVAAFVRELVERERAAAREQELLAMFNRAAEDLTDEDREERRLFMQAHPNRD